MRKTWKDRLPDVFGRRRIFELECQLEEAQGEIEELAANAEVVSADFEKDCWRAMRGLLDRYKFDWRDIGHDGVTADDAAEFISETIDDLDARLKRATAPAPQTLSVAEQDEKLWCESCGEAEQTVHLDHAGLCDDCTKQQGDE